MFFYLIVILLGLVLGTYLKESNYSKKKKIAIIVLILIILDLIIFSELFFK